MVEVMKFSPYGRVAPFSSLCGAIKFIQILEIRSVERGICPIVVLCFAVKRSFLTFKNFVGEQGYHCYHMLGHGTCAPSVAAVVVICALFYIEFLAAS